VIRDAAGPALMPRDQLREAFARIGMLPVGLERFDGPGGGGVRFASGRERC